MLINILAEELTRLSLQANRNGTLDTFGIGGIWAELAERDHLMRAQGLASHVDMLIRQAQSLAPEVNGLRMPKIVSPYVLYRFSLYSKGLMFSFSY